MNSEIAATGNISITLGPLKRRRLGCAESHRLGDFPMPSPVRTYQLHVRTQGVNGARGSRDLLETRMRSNLQLCPGKYEKWRRIGVYDERKARSSSTQVRCLGGLKALQCVSLRCTIQCTGFHVR